MLSGADTVPEAGHNSHWQITVIQRATWWQAKINLGCCLICLLSAAAVCTADYLWGMQKRRSVSPLCNLECFCSSNNNSERLLLCSRSPRVNFRSQNIKLNLTPSLLHCWCIATRFSLLIPSEAFQITELFYTSLSSVLQSEFVESHKIFWTILKETFWVLTSVQAHRDKQSHMNNLLQVLLDRLHI